MRTVIVKLGGAALTEKQTTSKLSPNFDDLVEQISQIYHINHSQQIQTIFIHGAGSFGHPQAKQYQVKYGWLSSSNNNNNNNNTTSNILSSKDIKYGMTTTRQNVLLLHNHLLQSLQSHGLPIVSVSPFDHIETSGGGEYPTLSSTMKVIQRCKHLLQLGFIPLLHGDAVLDDQLGCTILSGDVIMHQLATYFDKDNSDDNNTIERCIFVTDVEGIYTGDPKLALIDHSAVSLIKHIPVPLLNNNNNNNNNDHHNELDNNDNNDDNKIADVSGGIQGKMKWAKRIIVDSNVRQVIICKAGSPEVIHSITLKPIDINDQSFNQLSLTVFIKHE